MTFNMIKARCLFLLFYTIIKLYSFTFSALLSISYSQPNCIPSPHIKSKLISHPRTGEYRTWEVTRVVLRGPLPSPTVGLNATVSKMANRPIQRRLSRTLAAAEGLQAAVLSRLGHLAISLLGLPGSWVRNIGCSDSI